MKTLLEIIDTISESVGKVVSSFIVIVMCILVYETVMRYAFNAPTTWAHIVSWNFMSAYFVLGGAYTLLKKAHVNMDLVYNRLSLRKRAILDLFTATLFYFFCGTLFWKGLEWAWDSMKVLENSGPPLYLPIYPVKLLLALGALLLLLQGSAKFIRDFITAITGEEYGR